MKRWIPTILLVLVLIGGGYFFYTEQARTTGAPDKVAHDTGTLAIEEMTEDSFIKYGEDIEDYEKQYGFSETFSSWDELNEAVSDSDIYRVTKYPDKDLFLVYAAQQKDGQVAAIFSDKPVD